LGKSGKRDSSSGAFRPSFFLLFILAQTMVAVIIAPLQFLANQSVVLPTVGQFWPATAFHMGSTAPPVNDSFDSFGFDCTDG